MSTLLSNGWGQHRWELAFLLVGATGGCANTVSLGEFDDRCRLAELEVGDCPLPDPSALSDFGAWIDDFDSDEHRFREDIDWVVEDDGTWNAHTNASIDRPARVSILSSADGADPRSRGMRMAGCLGSGPARPGIRAWGAKWKYETPVPEGGQREFLDFSGHTGIAFWMRSGGTTDTHGIFLVQLSTEDTVPKERGGNGKCFEPTQTGTNEGYPCWAHWSYTLSARMNGTCWKRYAIRFDSRVWAPQFSGTQLLDNEQPFELSRIFGVEFTFLSGAEYRDGNWPFDLVIDNIYLFDE